MNADQQRQAEELFGDLLPLSASEREERLSQVEDLEVRQEVASLLPHAGDETGHFGAAIGQVMQSAASSGAFGDRTVGPGTRLGHYRIERKLGHGGMGDVSEAVRDDDFHKRVALKMVRQGLDSAIAHHQFQKERQVLASLEHPYIARLLDGGEFGNCPYLVLEYVEGTPIDQYCQGKPRDVILRLFLKVCEAVSYAHGSLIIHRDLKPANIMVTESGDPKLLDFGIARLLEPGADVTQTMLTALTPQYASPEQIRAEPVGTASDVYSLGMILYELLSGRKPYTLTSSSLIEVDRAVCQTDPARPGVSEDLDNILMMALRKDPSRRYRSVQELAQDIQRSLSHHPISARPDTMGYRTRKFVRRHWTGTVAAGALLLAIGGGMGATVYQARIARERFQQVRKLAHSFVFDYYDDLAKVPGNTAVREKMVSTALQYLDNLSQSAGNDLELQRELASAYRRVGDAQGSPSVPNLGHIDQAIASYRKAAVIFDRLAKEPAYRQDAADFYASYTGLLTNAADYPGAARVGVIALRYAEQLAKQYPDHEIAQAAVAQMWNLLGDIDTDSDQYTASLEKFHKAEAIEREVLKRWRSANTLRIAEGTQSRLAETGIIEGRLTEAVAAFDQDEALLNELLRRDPGNPTYLHSYGMMAQLRGALYYDDLFPNLDDPVGSLTYARQYLQLMRDSAEKDPNDAAAKQSLAIALFRISFPLQRTNPAEALQSARESIQLFDAQIAAGKSGYQVVSRRARALHRLSEALLLAGKALEARTRAAEAVAEERKVAAHDDREFPYSTRLVMDLLTSARVEEALHETARAEALLKEAYRMAADIHAKLPKQLAEAIPLVHASDALSEHWQKAGDQEQSRHWLVQGRAVWREYPPDNEFVHRQLEGFTVAPASHAQGQK